jgi:hypothetical protein
MATTPKKIKFVETKCLVHAFVSVLNLPVRVPRWGPVMAGRDAIMTKDLSELLGLTGLAVAAGCAAYAHSSLLFAAVFALAVGLGGAEILSRTFKP